MQAPGIYLAPYAPEHISRCEEQSLPHRIQQLGAKIWAQKEFGLQCSIHNSQSIMSSIGETAICLNIPSNHKDQGHSLLLL